MASLKGLIGLQFLSLSDTRVSDATLAELKGMVHLQELELNNTLVSDAGLLHLKGLTQLSRLVLTGGTRVTDSGIRALRKYLPNMNAVR